MDQRLGYDFFQRDVLEVAPQLIGKILVRRYSKGVMERFLITETEAYRGTEDMACHASKGRTKRTEIMFHQGGHVYVYLIYGMYWMMNFVCSREDEAQAVLIRGIEGYDGPGKLTKALKIDHEFYGENLVNSNRIWIENNNKLFLIHKSKRIGIEYAGREWANKKWRFTIA